MGKDREKEQICVPSFERGDGEPLMEMDPKEWMVVRNLPGNDRCAECNAKYPEWGSVNFGILFCTRCSSGHRALGTHISRVRSIRMDVWTEKQVKLMKAGGNEKCQQWLEQKGILWTVPIKAKYDNEKAKQYTEVLKARIGRRAEPISLKGTKLSKLFHKPREWWDKFISKEKTNTANNMLTSPEKSLARRIHGFSTSADVWLVAYVICLVAWAVFLVTWRYRDSITRHDYHYYEMEMMR